MDICTKIYITDKLFSLGQFLLLEIRVILLLFDIWTKSYPNVSTVLCQTCQWLDNYRTMFCQTVQYFDSVVTNSPMVGLCCVQLSDDWWAKCPTVQCLDCAFSNCPIVGQSFVQLSKCRIMLCETVHWLDSAVSNSPKVRLRSQILGSFEINKTNEVKLHGFCTHSFSKWLKLGLRV